MVRIKNRYMVVEIEPLESANSLHLKDHVLLRCVLQNVEKFFGTFGIGVVEQGFRVKYCNDHTKIAIIRFQHCCHRFVATSLPLITMIGNVRAKFVTLYTSATIMQCNKFIVRYQQQFVNRVVGHIASAKKRKDKINRELDLGIEK